MNLFKSDVSDFQVKQRRQALEFRDIQRALQQALDLYFVIHAIHKRSVFKSTNIWEHVKIYHDRWINFNASDWIPFLVLNDFLLRFFSLQGSFI